VPTQLGCEQAAAAYAQEIADVTLDVALNGMGPDGHTASLFPGFPQVHADGVCVAVHDSPKPPPDRVTLTLPKLNASHRILLVVAGVEKAPMLARVLAGPDPEVPASLLDRERLEIVADAAALDG
jgi:6-phosphogluconolactonase